MYNSPADRPMRTISVVVFREENCWIAQGLEYDIVAQSKTLNNIHYAFVIALASHIAVRREQNMDIFEGVSSAPIECWELYRDATRILSDKIPVAPAGDMPDYDMRVSA